VPEGEAFDVQLRLTNIGGKDIKVTGVMVTGEGMVLTTEVLEKNVDPKTVATVAKLPRAAAIVSRVELPHHGGDEQRRQTQRDLELLEG
jgi:hypothetical protein